VPEIKRAKARRPRLLIFAYVAEPHRGSESGAGWGLIQSVSEWADCCVLIGPDHIRSVRQWERYERRRGLKFVEVPEPSGAAFAKRHRVGRFLLYLRWLRSAFQVAEQFHRERAFDVAYHATYSTYWLPSPVWRLGIPSVWGPVGGAVATPVRLWPALGFRGILDQIIDSTCVRFSASWPSTRRTWRCVDLLIVQNEETLRRLPRAVRGRAYVLNHALFTPVVEVPAVQRSRDILWVSPMESRKGPRLAVRALATTPKHVRLTMVGDGPERGSTERLAASLDVRERIEFLGRVPRVKVFELLASASALLNTGLREEGGLSFAEAMLSGTPVIALGYGGPKTLARYSNSPERVILVEPSGVSATARRLGEVMAHLSQSPRSCRTPTLDSTRAEVALREIFFRAVDPSLSDVGQSCTTTYLENSSC
jgi:glycosyltransferase involved in cell wall biosynthesis